MGFEPGFGGGEIGAETFDLGPEPGGMVEMPQVGEFMEDDVVAYGIGGLDETPVERDAAAGGAGPPSRGLVAHLDGLGGVAVEIGEFPGAIWQLKGGEVTEVSRDVGAQVHRAGWGQRNLQGAQEEGGGIGGEADGFRCAAEKDDGSGQPFLGRFGVVGAGLQPFGHPCGAASDEGLGFLQASMCRHRASERAIASEGQPITPGPGHADESDEEGVGCDGRRSGDG